jgi:L-iditol 2-dehydrogenase
MEDILKKLLITEPGNIEICEYKSEKTLMDNEVRVSVSIGGICGSDISIFKGKLPFAVFPNTPGHEIIGKVVEVGKNVDLNIGDKVASYPNTYCGNCENCKKGLTNLCSKKKSFGVNIDGFFAEEVIVDSEFLVKVPEEMTDTRAVLLEPLSVCVHALSKTKIYENTSVAVIGCGTEGMLNIALLSFMKASITAIDINAEKLSKVKEFNKDIKVLLPNKVTDEKFDIVIESAGVKMAIEQAFTLVKPGGTLVAIGLTNENIDYPCFLITRSEIIIKGSIIYTKDDFSTALTYLINEDFNIEPVISKILPFSEFKSAYDYAISGKYVKILLDFN